MRYLVLSVVSVLCFLVLGRSAGAANDYTPAKNSAVTSDLSGAPPSGTLSATIDKGKKKYILVVHTTVQSTTSAATTLCVNNLLANNASILRGGFSILGIVCTTCPTAFGCALTTTHYLDIDEAESSSPGNYAGQPITIKADYSNSSGAPTSTIMAVEMIKK